MFEYQQWYQNLAAQRAIKALTKNNFNARFFPKAAEALTEFWKMVPNGATIGIAGSVTLAQIGFFDEIKNRPVKFLNPFSKGLSAEEGDKIRREILTADFFVASSNAITEDGKLYNIDATGNRVAPMIYGPKKVVLFCGTNKIVKNLDEAHRRVKEYTAPINVKRLGYKNPCGTTGECADCSSPERICNAYVVLARRPRRADISVFIIGESLGF
jgi:hypothetical protein